ncbi:MAG: hypothetical protein ACPG5B_02420 [Chitinophagales bacterium]
MKKAHLFTLLLLLVTLFYAPILKAQYNFPIENRPEIHHHIGFDASAVYLINEHLYAVSDGEEKLLTVFDVSYPKSIQVLKKIAVKDDARSAVCSLATLLGDTIRENSYLHRNCSPSVGRGNEVFKDAPFYVTVRENVVEFREEHKVISSLQLPAKMISRTKNATKLIVNNRYIAVLCNNLYLIDAYDVCELKIVGKYSFDEIEATNARKLFSDISIMKKVNEQTLFVNTKKQYFWIDISNAKQPVLKTKYAAKEHWIPEKIIENESMDKIFINEVAEAAEGYSEQKLIMLERGKPNKEWKESIIHETFGSDIVIVNNVGKTKNEKHLYFHDFNALYIFNKQTATVENVLYKTSTYRTDFVVLDDIVAVCGRNEFNDKINLFQNNGDASLNFVANMSGELRKKRTNCGLIAVKDNLMCIGGVNLGDGFDGGGLTVFNIDALTSPKYLFDGNKQKEVLPYRSYLTLSFYEQQLVASTTNYDEEGYFWTIYNLENPEMPKEISRKKQKIQRPYRHFRVEEEDIYYAIKYENSFETKLIELYVAYPSLHENEVVVNEFTYRLSEENHGLTTYETEILKKLQLILSIDKETQKVSYKYGEGKYNLKNGFLYKLTASAGIEVYKM